MRLRHTSPRWVGRRARQDADDATALVAFVVGHHVVGDCCCDVLD